MRESLVTGQVMKVVCATSGYSAGHSKYVFGTLRRSMWVIYLGMATINW